MIVSTALILAAVGTVALVLVPWIENTEAKNRWPHYVGLVLVLGVIAYGTIDVLKRCGRHGERDRDDGSLRAAYPTGITNSLEQNRLTDAPFRMGAKEGALRRQRPRPADFQAQLFLLSSESITSRTSSTNWTSGNRR